MNLSSLIRCPSPAVSVLATASVRRAAVLCAVVLAIPGLAGAQAVSSASTAPPAAEPIAEVIVTAQKRSEKLQDVPASVSVVTSDEITRSNAVTVEQLLNEVPGVTLHKGDIPFNSALFIRGIGTNSFALGAEPSVGYVVDGVVMGTAGQAFGDLLDVERMEVIPGPQGTLFGKNTSAGVVNVVSRMPGTRLAADVDVAYFEGDETRAKASVDLPITEKLLTRTTVFTGKYDGNITNLYQPSQDSGTSKVNGYDHQGVRSIWKFLPTDDLSFTLIGDWREANDNCCTFVDGTAPGTPPGATPAVIAGFTQLLSGISFQGDQTRDTAQSLVTQSLERERGFSLQGDWTFDGFTLTDIASYRYWWFDEIRDGDFLPSTAAYVGSTFEQEHDGGPQTVSTLTDELRLASPSGGTFEYVAGLYYYHTVQNRFYERDDVVCTASTLAPVSPGLVPCLPGASTYTHPSASGGYGSDIVNYAAFGQGTIRIVEPLRLIIGLRETHDSISFYHNYTLPTVAGGGGIISPTCAGASCPYEGTGSTTHSNLSGKAGLEWNPVKSEMAYFTYSRGYKGPAYNVFFNQLNSETAPLPSETSQVYEAGLKSTLLDGNAYLNLAVFHEAFDNYQANNPAVLNGVVITTLADAGSVATQGIELTGAAKITRAWGVNGGFTYANAHVTDFNAAAGANPFSIAPPGSPLPFAPKEKLNLSTDYRWTGALPFDILASTNFDYTSQQYTDFATCTASYCPHGGDNPYLRLHGYGLWNAALGASDRDDHLSATFLVKNILNRSYSSFDQINGTLPVQYFIPRDANRYWGLQLRYKFGG
jgi:iron complex outermembrane receptor protein